MSKRITLALLMLLIIALVLPAIAGATYCWDYWISGRWVYYYGHWYWIAGHWTRMCSV